MKWSKANKIAFGIFLLAILGLASTLHSINEDSCDPAIFGNLTSGTSIGYGYGSIDFPCNQDGYFPKIKHNSWGWMD